MPIARRLGSLRRRSDWLLVFALAALGELDLWLDPGEGLEPFFGSEFRGPMAVNAAFLLLSPVPLLWRRRAPLPALAVFAGLALVWIHALYTPHQPPIEPWFVFLILIYSIAAHLDGRRALLGAAIAAVAILAIDIPALVGGRSPGEIASGWPFYLVAWLLGRAVRRRQLQTSALEDRAVELEREQEERARAAVAEERARIARELHDVISHNVSVMVLQASVERRLLDGERESTREALLSIEQAGREALVELRRLLGVLRKGTEAPALTPQPSLIQLEALVEQVRDAGLPVDLRVEGTPESLPPVLDLSAYRIVQEGLTNVLKHAGAARAEVVVRYRDGELALEISDDGCGPTNDRGGGHGLIGMRERVALYGGVLEAGARNGGGYELRVRLPLEAMHS
jgi:signal transduction histidine kinase